MTEIRVTTSSDWHPVRDEMQQIIRGIGFNPDIYRMLKNIDRMVDDLSKAEVVARQTKKTHHLDAEIKKVNEAIVTLEKWLMLAGLMG